MYSTFNPCVPLTNVMLYDETFGYTVTYNSKVLYKWYFYRHLIFAISLLPMMDILKECLIVFDVLNHVYPFTGQALFVL